MMNVKLMMVDLDGTLLTSERKVTETTKQAILRLKQTGALFGIATGRTLYALERLNQEWGIRDLVDVMVGMNGAQYWDYTDGFKETRDYLSGNAMIEILEKVKDLPVVGLVYNNETREVYAEKETPHTRRIATNNHFELRLCDLKEILKDQEFEKLILSCDPSYMDTLKEICKPFDCEQYRGFCTGPSLYEFMNPVVSKSQGIQKICNRHGFDMKEVLVFGDNSNDLEMIRDAGIGVCMANGSADAMEVANYITLSNDEDGIAQFIDDYVL
ncbi:MAG: HAD family hydrolase [Erysipelotrichaceae bacterium]|nr:HAD family hydrolase [Erysipelotrichaceae bacterium]